MAVHILPLKSWPLSGGSVDLFWDKGQGFSAQVDQHGKIHTLSQEWIEGLPKTITLTPDILETYFSKTFVTVHPQSPDGCHLRISQKLLGGMFQPNFPDEDQDLNFAMPRTRVPFNPQPLGQRMEERGDQRFKMLSIDGGGIRGIIPLKILVELERLIGPCSETFDLIGGTSTGGIIALGLTTPFKDNSAEDLLDLYQNHSDQIFVKNPHRYGHEIAVTGATLGLLPEMGRNRLVSFLVNDPIYLQEGKEGIASEYLGESQMREARTNLLVTAADITTDIPMGMYFTNLNPEHAFFPMRDVASATSSPPTYFPHKILGGRKYIDGGLCYNDPAMQCHHFALQHNIPIASEYMLSLGTGFEDVEGIAGENHNLFWWAKRIFPAVGNAQYVGNRQELGHMLGNRYVRLDRKLEHEIPLDSNSPQTLEQLSDIGDELVERETDTIRATARVLRPDQF